jgi:hypothetical protein
MTIPEALSTVELSRREAASAGNSMIVPILILSDCAASIVAGHAIIKIRAWLMAC